MKNNTQTLQKLARYLKKYIALEIITIILAAVSVVASLYIPVLAGEAIDSMIGPGEVRVQAVHNCLGWIAILAAVSSVLGWLMNTVNNKIAFAVVRDIRDDAYAKLQKLPISYIDSRPHGDTVSSIISDVDQFSDGLLLGFTQLFTGAATIITTLVFMLMINPPITAVVVLLTPLSFVVASFIAKSTYKMFRAQTERRGDVTAYINEIIAGEDVVRVFSREDQVVSQFNEKNEKLRKVSLKAVFFSSITNPSTRFINNIMYAAVCLFGAFSVLSGGITVGALTSFLAYANQYTKPFNEISGVITELQNALACADRIFDLMEEPEYTPDKPDATELTDAQGKVELSGVDFSYDKRRELIKDFNLSVEPGQRIAIVGETGCGKTTIINLLMRFYDIDVGKITIDGTAIEDIKRNSLEKSFGMVLQDCWIMNGTIRDNIKMGRDVSDEEVIAASKAAHSHSFIKQLPDGYDAVVSGDFGVLSHGQKQLLCIARIMVDIPSMLILDEATSSIDTRTEMKIQNAFVRLMQGRTSFIVAHRLSTIKEADRIVVMSRGRIVESGKHEELLSLGGAYHKLWSSQFDSST